MLASQRYRMTLQLLDAEQLRAQQLSIPVVTQRIPRARRKSEQFDYYDILLARTRGGQRGTGFMTCVSRKLIPRAFSPSASTCRSQISYAILEGIEIIKVRMESAVETFISETQGQGFRACPKMS